MFTFKSASPNGINGTASYMVDIHLEWRFLQPSDLKATLMPRYAVYGGAADYTDGVYSPAIDGLPPQHGWRDSLTGTRRLLGTMEAYYGRLDGRLPEQWMYRVDSARGNVREFYAFGQSLPGADNKLSRIFAESDWKDAADWLIGWANPSGELYDLAIRNFSTSSNMMGYGVISLFNEQFIDLGA